MSLIRYGSVIALTVASFMGAIGCSPEPPQSEAKTAKVESEAEAKLAAAEPPGRSDEGQPQQVESDNEKPGEEVVEIPLDQIWALNMPGTRDVGELPTARADERIVEEISKALQAPEDNCKAAPGFALSGTDDEALAKTAAVLGGKKSSLKRLSADDNITVVFFSRQFRQYVHLKKVERRSNIVEVSYQFLPHEEAEVTQHFALIPLGELPVGKYRVDIVQTPMPQSLISMGFSPPAKATAEKIVCKSFDFTVCD